MLFINSTQKIFEIIDNTYFSLESKELNILRNAIIFGIRNLTKESRILYE